MSLLEQDHQEGAGVQDVRDVQDVQDVWRVRGEKYSEQHGFCKGVKNRPATEDPSPHCREHLGACIGSLTPPEAKQRLYPNQLTTISPPTAHKGSTHLTFALWASPPPPSKLRLLVAHADEWLSTMRNQLSTIRPTWVKGCQLSMI